MCVVFHITLFAESLSSLLSEPLHSGQSPVERAVWLQPLWGKPGTSAGGGVLKEREERGGIVGVVSISWRPLLIFAHISTKSVSRVVNWIIFLVLRIEIDPARLPVNEMQFYNNVLNPDKGKLVFVVTLKPCWGVSINDLNTAPLEQPEEKEMILEKFVNALLFLFFLCIYYFFI